MPHSPKDGNERVLSTLNADGTRRWLRPKPSCGRFHGRRRVFGWFLIVLFVSLPYIPINGKPAILLDILKREFTLFGKTFLATDTLLLMLFVMTLLVAIFLLTAVFGRVWCGWACPQTVYLELLFRPLERWIEGGHAQQKKLDKEGPNGRRLLRHFVFFAVSMFIAHVFLAYFVGVDTLALWVRQSPFDHPFAFLVMGGVTLGMFFDFTYFREQTCIVACPYGRLQSVLLDRDSLIVGYDAKRGEPRKRGKLVADEPRGDCVDCFKCVATCPTGIDIRDGLQMECIHCTQCIDACDSVMDRIGKPRGLIGYSSQNAVSGQKTRFVRPRVVLYPLLLAGLLTIFVTALVNKDTADVSIVRPPGATFGITPSGDITNRIKIRVTNRSETSQTYQALVVGVSGAEVDRPGEFRILSAELPATLGSGESVLAEGFVATPPHVFDKGRATVTIRVVGEDGFNSEVDYQLLGPWTLRK